MHTRISSKNLREKGDLGDLGVDGAMILKWISKKQYMRMLTGFVWLWIESSSTDSVNTGMILRVLQKAGTSLVSRATISFSRTLAHGIGY